MSPQTNAPKSTPSDGHKPEEASTEPPENYPRSNGGPERHSDMQTPESRMSGELEGSTLGSSSRDGDRGGRGQRRTASSGGFLLDSSFMPRSKGTRIGHHRPRRSEPDRREKRAAPEPDIAAPKKKSRFPWSRHKHAAGSSSIDASRPSISTAPQEAEPGPSGAQRQEHNERDATADTDQAAGLDADSIQIVNLALNLNESRRKTNIGRSASSRLPGGKLPAYGDTHTSSSLGHQPSQARHTVAPSFDNDKAKPSHPQQPQAAKEQPSLFDLIPDASEGDAVPFKPSDNTFARAEKARRHFELFSEYLRLLPSLPPLKSRRADPATEHTPATSDDASPSRTYNPLQSIRNRKVRFREKCPIDADAEGWNDVEKVGRWIDDVEEQASHQNHSPLACLDLPPFHKGQGQPGESEDPDMMAASPTHLRKANRTSSAKTPRPRVDWVISPAELLCDAAWLEDCQNKSKIIDRDGQYVYPEPSDLVSGNAGLDIPRSQKMSRLPGDRSIDQRPSIASVSESNRPTDLNFKEVGRGRQRHRLSSPHVSTTDTGLTQDEPRLQSGSSSAASSMRNYHYPAGSSARVDRGKSPETHIPGRLDPRISRVRQSGDYRDNITSLQDTGVSPYQSTKSVGPAKRHETKGSLSSGASIDDSYSPRMSLEAADISPTNSPSRAGYFPSITANLSPPSSRSPSPSKRPLSRAITPRHERSKSKNKKEHRDHRDDSPLRSEPVNKRGSQGPPGLDHSGRLEPSPLPDRISSSYQEGQRPSDLDGLHNARPQKGPSPQDSKLREFFKGRGKIAGFVGNEVSRVGDRIRGKEPPVHSRKSSAADSLVSGDSDMEDAEETKGEDKSAPSCLPTDSEDRGNAEKGVAKGSVPSFPVFTSSRQDDEGNQAETPGPDGAYERGSSQAYNAGTSHGKRPSPSVTQQDKLDAPAPVDRPEEGVAFSPSRSHARKNTKGGHIRDPSVPFGLTRPPVTGLAQAKASPDPSSRGRSQRMSEASRSWSISDRSLSTLADSGIPEKREIERTRALLLSSGIKAREITRRAETVRDPPDFLRSSVNPNEPVPRVARLHEFDVAAQKLLQGFERSRYLFQQSMDRFPAATSSPLRSQLSSVESLVNHILSPRVRTASDDAEDLSVQLHTTSTLAVKQLSDALDRGMRKRHRRLRLIRRAGFVVLEWALVGVLWWVWLIVMIFKLFRGALRGAVSGVRWVLWL
ncbi:hypothetical protein PHISP_03962 [Aspergillus sp. HF37]|nr:hypothetical protein PHISP_03962 [Aspergillus sp. HF37]